MKAPWQRIGAFRALVSPALDSPELRASLAQIESIAASPEATLLQAGRHRTVRLRLCGAGGRQIDAVAKFFGRQSPFKDLWDRLHSSKARRTFDAASFLAKSGIGTTPPVACLERWRGPRLTCGIFVSLYVDDALCFKDRLVELWNTRAPYSSFLAVLRLAATGIRALHDAGCRHGDLGNQNVFFTRRSPGGPYCDALFLDLNRTRFGSSPLTTWQRGRDLARICLPPGFMALFMRLYWGEEPPPRFISAWRFWYRLFRFHSKTRKFRHPFRELDYVLNPQKAPAQAPYPPARLQWVWDDEKSRPAQVAADEKALLGFLEPSYRKWLLREGRLLLRRFSSETLAARPSRLDAPPDAPVVRRTIVREADAIRAGEAVRATGCRKALVRISMAETEEMVRRRIEVARHVASLGVGVAIQIMQRPDFLGAESLAAFTGRVLASCGFAPDWVCVGQGVNTLAWGVRDFPSRDAMIAAGANIATDLRADSPRVLSTAVEAPVMQTGLANVATLFSRNVRYAGIALAWREGDGTLAGEARALRALAAGAFYARSQVFVISDSPVPESVEKTLRGLVGELCAPE